MKAKYGVLPTQKDLLSKRMKGPAEKKHFDSADWAQELSAPEKELAPSAMAADAPPENKAGAVLTEGGTLPPPPPPVAKSASS